MHDIDLRPFGPHLAWSIIDHRRLNVWEGAVRSGKTLASILAWLDFLEQDTHYDYEMSGYTMSSLINNVIDSDYGIFNLIPGSDITSGGKNKGMILKIPLSRGTVRCHLYGAPNVRSESAVRGLTSYGWYADEVNRQDSGFVAQSFNRMVQVQGGHTFWTLNPDNPNAPIYKTYIDRWRFETPEERRKFGGFNWWHCTFEDNPILTPAMIETIKMGYVEGSFEYMRDVLGRRVIAEGLVYPSVEKHHVFTRLLPDMYDLRYASIDYGATHANVTYIGGPLKTTKNEWGLVHEIYDDSADRTPYEIREQFEAYCHKHHIDPHSLQIAIDPSAEGLSNEFYNHKYHVIDAENAVLPGIDMTRQVMYRGKLKINDACTNLRREMSTYAWDEKASQNGLDKPIKANDDCEDSLRYFVATHMAFRTRI